MAAALPAATYHLAPAHPPGNNNHLGSTPAGQRLVWCKAATLAHPNPPPHASPQPHSPPEQRLLRPQDLHRGGWVLGQVGQAARVADQPRAHQLANEGAEVGGHCGRGKGGRRCVVGRSRHVAGSRGGVPRTVRRLAQQQCAGRRGWPSPSVSQQPHTISQPAMPHGQQPLPTHPCASCPTGRCAAAAGTRPAR